MPYNLLYTVVVYPILFILPAWVANATPVIFGGGKPLDLRKKILGKRVLGDHKTIRGTISGLLGGTLVSFFFHFFYPFISAPIFAAAQNYYYYPIALGLALTVGAVFGDLFGSFIKRRLGMREGANALLMDQYLFFVTALIFALPFGNFPEVLGLAFITLVTGPLHMFANIVAHRLKLKKVPW